MIPIHSRTARITSSSQIIIQNTISYCFENHRNIWNGLISDYTSLAFFHLKISFGKLSCWQGRNKNRRFCFMIFFIALPLHSVFLFHFAVFIFYCLNSMAWLAFCVWSHTWDWRTQQHMWGVLLKCRKFKKILEMKIHTF